MSKHNQLGFTLIELSIVLVIIGLIIGGVLVGRDLISAATLRAQVTQIEKIRIAVNNFQGKYNAIPGDMDVPTAMQFGFANAACSGNSGERNGNGLLESSNIITLLFGAYETGLFWNDLSSSIAGRLIEGSYQSAVCTGSISIASTGLDSYLPRAKVNPINFLYVFSLFSRGTNWIGLSKFQNVANGYNSDGALDGLGLSVAQAYSMDVKMDDGKPTTGNVLALYVRMGTITTSAPNAFNSSASTCYQLTTSDYSMDYNNGTLMNCALSFVMK